MIPFPPSIYDRVLEGVSQSRLRTAAVLARPPESSVEQSPLSLSVSESALHWFPPSRPASGLLPQLVLTRRTAVRMSPGRIRELSDRLRRDGFVVVAVATTLPPQAPRTTGRPLPRGRRSPGRGSRGGRASSLPRPPARREAGPAGSIPRGWSAGRVAGACSIRSACGKVFTRGSPLLPALPSHAAKLVSVARVSLWSGSYG